LKIFINLTPFIPLSFKGEGDGFFKKRGFASLRHPVRLTSLVGREVFCQGIDKSMHIVIQSGLCSVRLRGRAVSKSSKEGR